MKDKKIVFLGTPEIAAKFLDGIISRGIKISLVVTNLDKVRGRNNLVIESPVSRVARENNIKVFKPTKLNDDYSEIEKIKPDLILTFAYGQILSTNVLSLSKYKPLNIHGSLLPKYRGASPIQQALKNGDAKTGISIIEMVKEMDAGPIYAKKEIDIDISDNYTSLSEKVANSSIDLFLDVIDDYFERKIIPETQEESKVSYCHYILKDEYKLSLDEDVNTFINHVRYLSFTPGAYLNYDNNKVKIYSCNKYEKEDIIGNVGQLIIYGKHLLLQLKKGVVEITSLQFANKNKISSIDYINGNKNKEGIVLY